ncbi:MAG: valine--tRNA ligase [Legionellales bacterium]|nr:valine--tRNA ligase [Legionellales bacterium]
MEKTYNPKQIEQACYQNWEQQGYFSPHGQGQSYCIMLPPPNVTGTLHMGHGFQHAIMDVLIRYHRMKGDKTLWQVGTDHAGIATQMVVERQLLQQNVNRHDIGREAFLEKVWDWKALSGNTILQQMRRLGVSAAWSRERFTMDPAMSRAVQEAFIQLFDEGLIYRGQRLVNWDPKLGTAISDLEVVSSEEEGSLWHIRYPLADGSGHLVVATTRPETMLGDAAVAVNPEDERYQHLIGRHVHLPLAERPIPIIADPYVDREFGTGCVKITPAHDFNDYAIGQRHQLVTLNILNPDATLNENVPEAYRGLDRFAARKKVVEDLSRGNFLEKIEPHKLNVPRGDRSGEIIEPFLTYQWYVKTKPLAEPAIKAVESGDIRFVPENWSKTYFQWMHNIEDWCISRQIWWGHRIPAWYDEAGHIYVEKDEASVRQKYKLADEIVLTQDADVLDTWFSSALWPFSTLGWPDKTPELDMYYPTNVLVTGFDIIFFWVARMIMFGLKFMGKKPFAEVYVTGLIRDHEGQKMSKSKGNILDPIDLIDGIDLEPLVAKRISGLMQPAMAARIEKNTRQQFPDGIGAYGTDALRLTYFSISGPGRDLRFEFNRLESSRNFCNKLWNATRYVLMNVADKDCSGNKDTLVFSLSCRWIWAKLQETITEVRKHIDEYRFDLAVQALYEFTWNHYCDWYLELSKALLTTDQPEEVKQATRFTLINVLENLLRLLHPFMPFITETLWQQIYPLSEKAKPAILAEETIMIQPYPEFDSSFDNPSIIHDMTWIQNVIVGIRTIRAEMNINPGKLVPILLRNAKDHDKACFKQAELFILALAKLSSVEWLTNDQVAPAAATALAGEMEILIPLAGLIDVDAETTRLNKEIAKLQAEIAKCEGKLNNASFINKAPADVVTQEKARLDEFSLAVKQLQQQLEMLRVDVK